MAKCIDCQCHRSDKNQVSSRPQTVVTPLLQKGKVDVIAYGNAVYLDFKDTHPEKMGVPFYRAVWNHVVEAYDKAFPTPFHLFVRANYRLPKNLADNLYQDYILSARETQQFYGRYAVPNDGFDMKIVVNDGPHTGRYSCYTDRLKGLENIGDVYLYRIGNVYYHVKTELQGDSVVDDNVIRSLFSLVDFQSIRTTSTQLITLDDRYITLADAVNPIVDAAAEMRDVMSVLAEYNPIFQAILDARGKNLKPAAEDLYHQLGNYLQGKPGKVSKFVISTLEDYAENHLNNTGE